MVEASSVDGRLGGRRLPCKDIESRVDPILQEQTPLLVYSYECYGTLGCEMVLRKKKKILPRSTGRHDARNAQTVSGT